MKNLFLPVFLILTFALNAQDPTFLQRHLSYKDGKVFYQKVVEVEGATVKDMFVSSKIWANDAFGVTKNDLQVEELERGLLVFVGSVIDDRMTNVSNPTQSFKLKLEFKEGKYRYTMYDFVTSYEADDFLFNKAIEEFLAEYVGNGSIPQKRKKGISDYLLHLNRSFLLLMDDLEKELKGGNSDDDW